MLFFREIKVLEARQRLEALVIPKRPTLTLLQGLLAPLLHLAEMAFPQHLKTSIFRLFGYINPRHSFFAAISLLIIFFEINNRY